MDLHRIPAAGASGMPMPGTLVATIGEVRQLLGPAFETPTEVRNAPR